MEDDKIIGKELTQEDFNEIIKFPKGKELSLSEFEGISTDKLSACKECFYRLKDKGVLTDSQYEMVETIYGCRLGQYADLTKLPYELPKECKAKNFTPGQSIEIIKAKRNNCHICNITQEGKQACKKAEELGRKVKYCPCKECTDIFILDSKCIYEGSCKKRVVLEEIPNEVLGTEEEK